MFPSAHNSASVKVAMQQLDGDEHGYLGPLGLSLYLYASNPRQINNAELSLSWSQTKDMRRCPSAAWLPQKGAIFFFSCFGGLDDGIRYSSKKEYENPSAFSILEGRVETDLFRASEKEGVRWYFV